MHTPSRDLLCLQQRQSRICLFDEPESELRGNLKGLPYRWLWNNGLTGIVVSQS